MIIESHWKVLKHDYLYRFHRPPLDYVVYVLCEKLLPAQCNRFYQLSIGRIYPHWWEDFKKEWKQCVLKSVDEHYWTGIMSILTNGSVLVSRISKIDFC